MSRGVCLLRAVDRALQLFHHRFEIFNVTCLLLDDLPLGTLRIPKVEQLSKNFYTRGFEELRHFRATRLIHLGALFGLHPSLMHLEKLSQLHTPTEHLKLRASRHGNAWLHVRKPKCP